ncbi:MAG: hypothetical protein I4N51_14300 [Acinetobacter sp.]|nr:hypothetical protein [Acinetobacter sp.]
MYLLVFLDFFTTSQTLLGHPGYKNRRVTTDNKNTFTITFFRKKRERQKLANCNDAPGIESSARFKRCALYSYNDKRQERKIQGVTENKNEMCFRAVSLFPSPSFCRYRNEFIRTFPSS